MDRIGFKFLLNGMFGEMVNQWYLSLKEEEKMKEANKRWSHQFVVTYMDPVGNPFHHSLFVQTNSKDVDFGTWAAALVKLEKEANNLFNELNEITYVMAKEVFPRGE